ncbi:replication initiator protein A (plasmid) [Lactiplantibacillus plantarum]|nr:replication initiator protein A [Lactiplantibacillus plantarum]
MRRFVGIILNAKYRVEKDHKDISVIIPLDDIKNVENYLYGTMQNLFGVWWNKQAAREYAAKHPEEEKPADNDNSGLYY